MTRRSFPNPFFEAPLYYKEETGSTMEDAAALIRAEAPSGTLVAAGYQHRGRGRIPDRRWDSPPGTSLLFTLILDPGDLPGGSNALPLRAGLGLSRYLEEVWRLLPRIKWPNDLLVQGAKIAGILCQGRGGMITIGMGLNLNRRLFSRELRQRATSLESETGECPENLDALEGLLPYLHDSLHEPAWREAVEKRLFGIGEFVQVFPGAADTDERYDARIRGLSSTGALRLEPVQGAVVELVSGEILFQQAREAP